MCKMMGDYRESSAIVMKSVGCSTCDSCSPVMWSFIVVVGGSSPIGNSACISLDSLCCTFSLCVRASSGWVCCSVGCLFSSLVCSLCHLFWPVSCLYHLFRLAYSGCFFFPSFWGIRFGLGLDSFLFISVQIYGELQLLVREFLD